MKDFRNFFLYVLPIAVGLATYIWDQKFGPLLAIPGLALAGAGAFTVCAWLVNQLLKGPSIQVYAGGDDTPRRLRPKQVLRELRRDDALIIVARTCKRWLVSDDEARQAHLHTGLVSAIERGARVTFVLQDLAVGLENFSTSEKKELAADQRRSINQLRNARRVLRRNRGNLTCKFREQEVTNSMVVLTHSGEFVRLVQDIGMGFNEKSFVVITDEKQVQELLDWLDDVLDQAMDEKRYVIESGWRDVTRLMQECTDHLPIRANDSSRLLPDAASRYLCRAQGIDISPPVSVQLELTNTCQTVCKMCTHYLLGDRRGELSTHEILRVLDWLHELGSKNIILSGGEPLAHPDISEILSRSKKFSMRVGILSSGVVKGKSVDEVTVNGIAASEAWVQISIDAFNPTRYKEIRGAELDACIGTVESMSSRGVRVQVCYTIQKHNIKEVLDGTAFQASTDRLPQGVSVRFKFAHGFGGEFLIEDEQLREVVSALSAQAGDTYIEEMLEKGYFTYQGIGRGLPTEEKMRKYAEANYSCHALDLTLFIDANGDVYPCCYLFDDNVGNSPYRSSYKLGSLRSTASRMVPSRDDVQENPIRSIWVGRRLNDLRAQKLPIEPHACGKCTRHIHQNEFLNRLRETFDNYGEYSSLLAQEVIKRQPAAQEGTWV